MKKAIALLLILSIAVLALVGCGSKQDGDDTSLVYSEPDFTVEYDFTFEIKAGADILVYMSKEGFGLTAEAQNDGSRGFCEKLSFADLSVSEILCSFAATGMSEGLLKSGDDFTVTVKDVKDCENVNEIMEQGANGLEEFCGSAENGYYFNVSLNLPE